MTETPNTPPPKAWHDGVDAAVIQAWTNKGYDLANPKETAAKMWEQYSNLERHFGVPADRLLRLPKDAADADGWAGVHQRLGVPKEAKDYDFNGVKFADGTDLEQGFTDSMRGALHKANVSKEASTELVKAVVKYFDDADAAEKAEHAAMLNAEKAKLAKEWGPSVDHNMLLAQQAAKRLGLNLAPLDKGGNPEDHAAIAALEKHVGYARLMEMFRKIGAGTTEDSFVGGGGSNPTTAANAQARLNDLQNDREWVKRLMAGDVATKREFHALTEQIAGTVAA